MEDSIRDPVIPFVGAIAGRFTPGKIIRIQGAVPGIAYRFDINLQCGPQTSPRDDIALQISVRILDGYIAMNSLQNGVWGEELRGNTQPVKRADRFEIIIMCDFNKYKVIVNGQLFYDFPQKIHYDCITHLTIEGDVTINEIFYGSHTNTNPIPALVPTRQLDDDFEILNIQGPKDSQPPSYSEIVQNYPGNAQQYPGTAPYPSAIRAAPYPPYPNSFPSPSAPNMTLPPTGMPMPLNAASSNFRPVVQKLNRKKCCGYFWAIFIGVMIVIAVIVSKVKRKASVYVVDNSYDNNYNWR